jgi:TolA-binding protein
MAEKIFIKGFRSFPKHEKAPDFVLGTLILTIEDLTDFINNDVRAFLTEYQNKKQLKIQVTKGKKGELVFAVDTWKAEPQEKSFDEQMAEAPVSNQQRVVDNDENLVSVSDDLPF